MTSPTRSHPMQKAWVVTDIETAARAWSHTLGIGPFFIAEYRPEQFLDLEYRGGPGTLHMKTAIAYAGDEQIELVEPLGDAASAYRDTVAVGDTGFHHLCFWSRDLDADLAHYAANGAAVANRGRLRGGPRFAYVDASATLGCMVELLEWSDAIETFFNGLKAQCERWDGVDPLRFL